jgi:2,7-dihydroxy-5-methyl-1-naphthoate 7-O-methyltransferase
MTVGASAGSVRVVEIPSIFAMADLATPMSIRVAATLNLVEHARSEGAPLGHPASVIGTSALALERLLARLVSVGVFELDPVSGAYRPTSIGAQTAEDAPEGVKP